MRRDMKDRKVGGRIRKMGDFVDAPVLHTPCVCDHDIHEHEDIPVGCRRCGCKEFMDADPDDADDPALFGEGETDD